MRNLRNSSILQVEDNPIDQKIVKIMLGNWGMIADTAGNGKEAVQKVKEKKYDIILMDIYMPEMDGYEATKIIRQTYSKEELPIFATSSATSEEEKQKCLAAGMTEYVQKPFNLTELNEKIYQALMIKNSTK